MHLPKHFIQATLAYNTLETQVPAYYFRRCVTVEAGTTARLRVAVCGFYELFLNGERITRGLLSPYISNPDDMVYYDEYTVSLTSGENVLGLILGNGFQNNPGGYIWDFDKAAFRSAPKLALTLEADDGTLLADSGSGFCVAPSHIVSDDYRFGEHVDARLAIPGWSLPGFDDTEWQKAIPVQAPKGELRVADVEPIIKEREIAPISITKSGDGYIYDFGESNAGICRLRVKGTAGQKIELRHADATKDGDIRMDHVWFVREHWERDRHIVHLDTYICAGDGEEIYEPSFTYHGFRYVRVDGITEEQATPELLTYLVYHTDLGDRGNFACSDDVANKIQDITRRSIVSNFHHFPTDCPQREKNGWTADAALSCEAALLNFAPERNYREWQRNICKAQSEQGSLPGIVPTGGWGFAWGNGPAWDCILVYLPYFTYLYRGETAMIRDSAKAFLKYLAYLRTRVDERGLLAIGLGDWCHIDIVFPECPLVLTDSVISMDIAYKMAFLLDEVGLAEEVAYARSEGDRYRAAIRAHLIDQKSLIAHGACQTAQAMCLFYGLYEADEEEAAFEELLNFIHKAEDHMDLGVLGARVIFHVLDRFGYSDLAWRVITRTDYPSYGNWVARGATTLWESFFSGKSDGLPSLNHHFWGDVSAWFIKTVAGIRVNPTRHDPHTVTISPAFIRDLDHASAYHDTVDGRVSVSWKREGEEIVLTATIPENAIARLDLRDGYTLADGSAPTNLKQGVNTFRIVKEK